MTKVFIIIKNIALKWQQKQIKKIRRLQKLILGFIYTNMDNVITSWEKVFCDRKVDEHLAKKKNVPRFYASYLKIRLYLLMGV